MESGKLNIVEAYFTHTQWVKVLKVCDYDNYDLFYTSILHTMYALWKEYVSDITVVLSDWSSHSLPIDPTITNENRLN